MIKPQTFLLSVAVLVCACTPTKPSLNSDLDVFISDVPLVKDEYLSPSYWIKPGMDKVSMNQSEIAAYNRQNIASDPNLFDLTVLPESLSKAALTQKLRAISNKPSYPRIDIDGTLLGDADFVQYEQLLNLDNIGENNPVQFALAVRRTSIRTYPTHDLLFSHDANDRDIERFQESALFPGDALAVLHESTDGQWALIQSYNYIAWVPLADIAIGSRTQVLEYSQDEDFLLITGDKVSTVFNPEEARVSELQLDMGVKVPLSRPEKFQTSLYGQNPYLSHMVKLPVRSSDGSLAFQHALIARNKDVHVGYLPYTQANIIKQSFKFLGERYGWGHRFNGRDCTGFVSEIYKTFGFKLPRNSSDQRDSDIGINDRFKRGEDYDAKITRLRGAEIGDLVYIPGHVFMVIGTVDDEPFAIHDVHGMRYKKPDGTLYSGTLNGVSLTPILPMYFNKDETYVERILGIKTIR